MSSSNEKLDLHRRCAATMLADDLASRALGMDIEIPALGQAIATMRVREDMVNGHEVCHGGYIFTLADSAFAFACNAYDQVTLAAAASIEFIAPARLGDTLVAHACEVHRRGRNGVYDISVKRDDGEPVALFRGRSVSLRESILEAGADNGGAGAAGGNSPAQAD